MRIPHIPHSSYAVREFIVNYAHIAIFILIVTIIITLAFSIIGNNLPIEEEYIDSFSTARNPKLESFYQCYFADRNIPYYLVEGIWQAFIDVLIVYYRFPYNDITYINEKYSREYIEDDFLKPNFTWDFSEYNPRNQEILVAIETKLNIRITGEEARKFHTFMDIVDCINPKLRTPFTVLVDCPGDPSRSIMAGILINHLGKGRFRAFYLNHPPTEKINPHLEKTLEFNDLPMRAHECQAWDESVNTPIDIAITLLDKNSEEFLPALPENITQIHWNIPNPALLTGSKEEINEAFQATYDILVQRIEVLLAIPIESMLPSQLSHALNRISI